MPPSYEIEDDTNDGTMKPSELKQKTLVWKDKDVAQLQRDVTPHHSRSRSFSGYSTDIATFSFQDIQKDSSNPPFSLNQSYFSTQQTKNPLKSLEILNKMGKKTHSLATTIKQHGENDGDSDIVTLKSAWSNDQVLTPRGDAKKKKKSKMKEPESEDFHVRPKFTTSKKVAARPPPYAGNPNARSYFTASDTQAFKISIQDPHHHAMTEGSLMNDLRSPTEKFNDKITKLMEHSPLLRPIPSIGDDPAWEYRYAVETIPNAKSEFWELCTLSYPVIFTYVLEFLPGLISAMLVGHMQSPHTKEYVDGVSLSTMIMNLTAVAFGFGLATALDTLCSQAYGAGKAKKLGVYFQSGLIVLGVAFIPVFLVNWYAENVLRWMGQPPVVSALAGRFSRFVIPSVPFLFIYELMKKILQAQGIVTPMVYIAIASNVVNAILGCLLCFYTPIGYDGVAIARMVAHATLPGLLIPYFARNPVALTAWWGGWDYFEAKRHVPQFLALGVPGMLMMLMEWWSYEIMAAFVGLLPNSIVAISVQSVLVNISTLAFNVNMGIAVAGNIRVGTCVGKNQPEHAKLVSNLAMYLAVVVAAMISVIIIMTRNVLPHLFINDPITIKETAYALLFLIPFQLMDALNGVTQGVFRGTGRQTAGAIINFIAYFIAGLPFGIYLAFHVGLGVEGLWLGMTLGVFIGCSVSVYLILKTDWRDMADAARLRSS